MGLIRNWGQRPPARLLWLRDAAAISGVVAVVAAALALPSPASSRPLAPAAALQAAGCRFVLGFAALRGAIGPAIVGDCLEDERFNPANGNAEQRTTGGLLVWRKADNWTAFTDGHRTWVSGPAGIEQRLNTERFLWENDPAVPTPVPVSTTTPPPASATPMPSASSTPAPGSQALPPVDAALRDASSRLNVPRDQLRLERVEGREWSDSSLGCPQPGQFYLQVITPGYLVVISGAGQQLEYHTNERTSIVLCASGPARGGG